MIGTAEKVALRFHPASAPDYLPVPQMRDLQLGRLQTTVRRAYDNVELFRERMKAHGLQPDDIQSLDDLPRLPFTVKTDLRDTYPYGLFACPLERDRPAARLQRHHRQADRGRLHAGRPGRLDLRHGPGPRLLRNQPRRHFPERARLRAVHRRAGLSLRRGSSRRHRDPRFRRQHRPPGHADEGFQGHRHLRHAELLRAPAGARLGDGHRRARAAVAGGRLRRRAVERVHAPATSRTPGGIKAYDCYGLSEITGPGVARGVLVPGAACTSSRTTSIPRSSIPKPA